MAVLVNFQKYYVLQPGLPSQCAVPMTMMIPLMAPPGMQDCSAIPTPAAFPAPNAMCMYQMPGMPSSREQHTDASVPSAVLPDGSPVAPVAAAPQQQQQHPQPQPLQQHQQHFLQQQPGVQRIPFAQPCAHNSWDNVRLVKKWMTLRCRVCQRQFKIDTETLAETKCDRFQLEGGCFAGDACTKLHIHRKKQRIAERLALHGLAVLRSGNSVSQQ